jgi:hypothetical protein
MRSGDLSELRTRAVAGLQQGIDGLRRCAQADLDADSLTALVCSAFTLRNKLDAAITLLVSALDQGLREPSDTAASSAAALLRDELRLTNSAAHGQVRLARQLRELPQTAAAYAGGELSYQHAMVVTRTLDRVVLGGGRAEDAEPLLLAEARDRDPHDLLLWGRSLRHQLNPAELADEEEQEHRRRWLSLSQTWDGGYDLEGHLDAEGGTTLKVALQGLLGPRRKDDERTPGQRRADGLVEVARRCLDSGELPVRGGQRPHITITATLETLRGDPGSPAAELDWGFPISGDMLRRIACDAELTPILLAANGDPLHVGRARRTAPPRLRKALAQRDRRCVWPGCDRAPSWCDGHHRRFWARGGMTAIDEMSLLCGRHHRKVHAGYKLVRQPDGRVVVVAPVPAGPVFGPAVHAPPPAA